LLSNQVSVVVDKARLYTEAQTRSANRRHTAGQPVCADRARTSAYRWGLGRVPAGCLLTSTR
jgi:hypothetical protein